MSTGYVSITFTYTRCVETSHRYDTDAYVNTHDGDMLYCRF